MFGDGALTLKEFVMQEPLPLWMRPKQKRRFSCCGMRSWRRKFCPRTTTRFRDVL